MVSRCSVASVELLPQQHRVEVRKHGWALQYAARGLRQSLELVQASSSSA